MTERQRLVLSIRHPLTGVPPIFEKVADQLHLSYRKALVEYERARAALSRLKIHGHRAELGPEAQADVDRFGRFIS